MECYNRVESDVLNVHVIQDVIDILNLVSKISFTIRRGLIRCNNEGESVASHMYKMVFLVIVISSKLNLSIDLYRCILMVIVHDLAEAYVGDVIPNDNISIDYRHMYELEVISKIFKLKGESTNQILQEFYNAYEEYCTGKTEESKLVKFVDKIDFLYEVIRSKNMCKNNHSDNTKRLEEMYSLCKDAILKHNWGNNSKGYLEILKLLCNEQDRAINLPIFYLFDNKHKL